MTNDPIYKPSGRAKEYGDYAINIYTGCPHECFYCFAPSVLRKSKEAFQNAEPRVDIVRRVEKQLSKGLFKNELIHLCFTCDPYPVGADTTATREIIKLIKNSGNHVQILTKAGPEATRDFDLLGEQDWFGATITCADESAEKWEPKAAPNEERLNALEVAHKANIKTWLSLEPVLEPEAIYDLIRRTYGYVDKYKIGKLNYMKSTIKWGQFANKVSKLCDELGCNYYIKEDLKKEMERTNG